MIVGLQVFNCKKFNLSLNDWLYQLIFLQLLSGRKDSHPVDCPRGYSLQEVYISQWCLELWHCALGGDVIWGTAILGDVQSGCECCQFAILCERVDTKLPFCGRAAIVHPGCWQLRRGFIGRMKDSFTIREACAKQNESSATN